MRVSVPPATGPTHFRGHARLRVELAGTLSLPRRGATCDVRVVDLGLGGAAVELDADAMGHVRVAPDARVTLALGAPTRWDPLELAGRVAWARAGEPGRPSRAGICFEEVDATRLLALFELLADPGSGPSLATPTAQPR
jgi:hypothetical protein